MLLLNEKETKIIMDAMEFLETLGTPEATKQVELIDSVTYSQVNQDADEMDQLNDYYIEEREDGTSDNVIRLDIAYTDCFI